LKKRADLLNDCIASESRAGERFEREEEHKKLKCSKHEIRNKLKLSKKKIFKTKRATARVAPTEKPKGGFETRPYKFNNGQDAH
jgi:hypothetical protein